MEGRGERKKEGRNCRGKENVKKERDVKEVECVQEILSKRKGEMDGGCERKKEVRNEDRKDE